jgi:initiation factor 1A
MTKNRFGGNRTKRLKNHIHETIDISKLPLAISNSNEPKKMYAQVKKLLGDSRMELLCDDSEKRIGIIPGSMKKHDWIYIDDIVLAQFRECDTDKKTCDILHKYNKQEVKHLKILGVLAFVTIETFIDESINEEEEEEFDFDNI